VSIQPARFDRKRFFPAPDSPRTGSLSVNAHPFAGQAGDGGDSVARRAPSFDKLCREIERVLSQSRFKVEEAVPLIDQRLQQIFREAFDNDKLSVTDSLSPETMPEWDSLVQVKLIVGCEEEFGVKFSIEATIESNSVGKLKSVLVAKGVAS